MIKLVDTFSTKFPLGLHWNKLPLNANTWSCRIFTVLLFASIERLSPVGGNSPKSRESLFSFHCGFAPMQHKDTVEIAFVAIKTPITSWIVQHATTHSAVTATLGMLYTLSCNTSAISVTTYFSYPRPQSKLLSSTHWLLIIHNGA